ncbi:MAG: S41 family peptidase [Thioploca sp.]|nr:S41 family peptidase [Thioploca sp.]
MLSLNRHLLPLLLGTLLGGLITLGGSVLANRTPTDLTGVLPLEELRTFTEVFHRIKTDYVEEVEDKTLLENAIKGMLAGLDPHSSYLTPEDYQELTIGTRGEFGGLGIEVGMDDGFVKVISPIDDTPAQRAGIKAGDIIIRLDDTPVKGMTLSDAVKIMRGKPGSRIKLTIVRETEDKPITIDIVRDIIQVKSVKSHSLESGYGYVRISHFQEHTGEDLEKAVQKLKQDNQGKLKGLVLDLRNNPGGVLNAAVAVSDAFLSEGMVVYTEGRVADASLKFTARPKDVLNGAPIVILVNGGSASASEIVAGALQDHKRAVIMGNKTFGKGSVQTILPMNNNAALKLTTAHYYTPSGRSIQAEGIQPDITLNKLEFAALEDDNDESLIDESKLHNSLQNPNNQVDKTEKKAETKLKPTTSQDEKESLVKEDYAVYEALNLLKGLNIIEMNSTKTRLKLSSE